MPKKSSFSRGMNPPLLPLHSTEFFVLFKFVRLEFPNNLVYYVFHFAILDSKWPPFMCSKSGQQIILLTMDTYRLSFGKILFSSTLFSLRLWSIRCIQVLCSPYWIQNGGYF